MNVRQLALNERAMMGGFTHVGVIDADDLTQAGANTAQTVKLCDLVTGDIVGKIGLRVKTPLENTADATFNSSTVSVGDNAAVNTFLAAAEANKNGVVVATRFSNTAVGPYAAPDKIAVTVNAMAAKNLNSINKGEIHVFFQLIRLVDLEQASSGLPITTK